MIDFINSNLNKTEKEQLTSLMEKFNLNVDEAMNALTEELGDQFTDSESFNDSYWEIVFESNRDYKYGADFENIGEDW